MPNPNYEKSRKVVFYDPEQHQYLLDPPKWVEIQDGHFILANQPEIDVYKTMLESNIKGE